MSGVAIGAAPSLVSGWWNRSSPALLRDRLDIQTGVRSGDVTADSAVLWASSSGEGRLEVRLRSNGRTLRSLRGPWAD